MGYTVLKVSKIGEKRIEVAGEFPNEEEANNFAGEIERNEPTNDYSYLVEKPPSYTDPPEDNGL
jgi:hypothetical protein